MSRGVNQVDQVGLLSYCMKALTGGTGEALEEC